VTGAREDKGLASVTPMLVNTIGRSLSCSLIHLLLPPEPDQQVHLYQTPRLPTIRAGMIRDRGQGWGRAVKVEVEEMT
jgi:hypothetical protein